VEYTVFKHYACPDNYCQIIGKLIELSKRCVETHGHFEVHVNLDTFSVTAAERYKGFIQLFCEQSQASGTPLSEDLSCLYLYNIPAMMDSISRMLSPLVPPEMREKRKMFKKDVSDQLLKTLHSAI
jgi:hypothetical protein